MYLCMYVCTVCIPFRLYAQLMYINEYPGQVNKGNVHHANKAREQFQVTSLYNIPYLNIARAFLPFESTPFKRFWLSCVLKVDSIHLSQIGLQLLAAYIGQFIREQVRQEKDVSKTAIDGTLHYITYIHTQIQTKHNYKASTMH